MKRWECQLLCCVLCSITERICGNDGSEVLFNWKALLKFILKSLLWISQSIVIPLSNLPVQLSIIWHQMFNGTVWSSMICRWLSSFKRKIWKPRLSCRSAIKTCEDLGSGRALCQDWFSGKSTFCLSLWFLSLLDYKSYSDDPIVFLIYKNCICCWNSFLHFGTCSFW